MFGPLCNQMIGEVKKAGFVHADESIRRKDGVTRWPWMSAWMWSMIIGTRAGVQKGVSQRVRRRHAARLVACLQRYGVDYVDRQIKTLALHDSWPACNDMGSKQQGYPIRYRCETKGTMKHRNPTRKFIPFARHLGRIFGDWRKYWEMDPARINHGTKPPLKRMCKIIKGTYADRRCKGFVRMLRRERNTLFTFPAVGTGCHSNRAERAARPGVPIRRITNGSRSDEGVVSHRVMTGIREACRQRGINLWDLAGRIALKNQTITIILENECKNKMMFTDSTSVHILSSGVLKNEHDVPMSTLFSFRKATAHRSLDLAVFGSSDSTNSSFWH